MRYHLDPAGEMVSKAGPSEDPRDAIARLEAEVASLRRSRRRLAAATHSERRAMEREFHDGVQQDLVALSVDLQRLAHMIERDRDGAKALVAEMQTNIRAALDEASGLATRIYPPIIDGRGFAAALRSAANREGVVALVDVPSDVDYPPEILAALSWTWIDALASGSPGSEPSIRALEADGGLAFEVTSAGLRAEGTIDRMRDRIEALDGRIRLDDRQDGGLRLQGWLPLLR